MRATIGQITRLTRLCVSGEGGRLGVVYFFIVLCFELFEVYLSVRMIAWTADFYDALEQMDGAEALRQVGVFGVLIALQTASALASDYVRKLLQIRWRRALTAVTLDRWLSDKAFWRLRPGFSAQSIDNPDQRIAEDCRIFVESLLRETLDLIAAVVALFSYVSVLWGLSTFPLAFSALGIDVAIPHYMVWAAFLYVALSSGLTHLLGKPLKGLLFEQQRREADYRHALVRLRDSAGEIAISGGEPAERRLIDRRFGALVANWKRLIGQELILGLFTKPYFFTILRIPVFLALPAYFAGSVTLGGLMQLARAFMSVATTLSWFIFSYKDLAELVATSARLTALLDAAGEPFPPQGALHPKRGGDGALRIRDLSLTTPDGRPLSAPSRLTIEPGETVWISGPSGVGKSTLLHAIAGLWPFGSGEISLPKNASVAFLPQAPYLPLDRLAVAAAYPQDPAMLSPELLPRLMADVGMAHRIWALDEPGEKATLGLSGGERQRMALLRLLISKPDWIFLDEATSALDAEAEATLLALLRQALPDATFVIVAHREPQGLGPVRRIAFPSPSSVEPSEDALA